MICVSCRIGVHMCRGGTWCDCQHRSNGGKTKLEEIADSVKREMEDEPNKQPLL